MKKFLVLSAVVALMLFTLVPAFAAESTVSFNDWYNDWGAVKCMDITFNVAITEATAGSIASSVAEFIVVNGVTVKERMENPTAYNVGDCSGFNGLSADIGATENNNRILIYIVGGGTGDLVQTGNTVVFKEGMPLKTGTLERDITMIMGADGKWTEFEEELPVSTDEELPVSTDEELPASTADPVVFGMAAASLAAAGCLVIRRKRLI